MCRIDPKIRGLEEIILSDEWNPWELLERGRAINRGPAMMSLASLRGNQLPGEGVVKDTR